jgi:hypothetical protein
LHDLQGYDSLQTKAYKGWLNIVDGGQDSSPLENGNMDLTFGGAVQDPQLADEAALGLFIAPVDLGAGLPPAVESDGRLWVYQRSQSVSRFAGSAQAQIVADLPTRIVMYAGSTGDITVRDQNYPGWRAQVNGHPVPIRREGVVGKTINGVTQGSHVLIAFQPESFLFGVYLACFGLLAIAFVCSAEVASRMARH